MKCVYTLPSGKYETLLFQGENYEETGKPSPSSPITLKILDGKVYQIFDGKLPVQSTEIQ